MTKMMKVRRQSGLGPRLMLGFALVLVAGTLVAATTARAATWDDYLDYAYIYSSADAQSLSARIAGYEREIGLSLDAYVKRSLEDRGAKNGEDLAQTRRRAIAQFLQYLAAREPAYLENSVDTIRAFSDVKSRQEDRYWYHYIGAHRALERGSATEFVKHVLSLWMDVVVPLESPFDTLQALSLSQAANSGFVSALPYVYENVARLVLLRSQEMGMGFGLDSLAAIVRLLGDQRVGAYPEVIPVEASVRDYLERIVARLEGPESDGGSLTFTLVLFEASKAHDKSRGLLASEGFSDASITAIRATGAAYARAADLAETPSGEAAVYMRILRQMGEVHAAKQRLGVDPDVELPFTIEGAYQVYASLHQARKGEWRELGFRNSGEESYLQSMRGLWEEIQEATLNGADYYLSRASEDPARSAELVRNAARLFARYLAHFERYAVADSTRWVPDSAYFSAYEAARGYGDAFIAYGIANPAPAEIQLAASRYHMALRVFPSTACSGPRSRRRSAPRRRERLPRDHAPDRRARRRLAPRGRLDRPERSGLDDDRRLPPRARRRARAHVHGLRRREGPRRAREEPRRPQAAARRTRPQTHGPRRTAQRARRRAARFAGRSRDVRGG